MTRAPPDQALTPLLRTPSSSIGAVDAMCPRQAPPAAGAKAAATRRRGAVFGTFVFSRFPLWRRRTDSRGSSSRRRHDQAESLRNESPPSARLFLAAQDLPEPMALTREVN